MARPRNCDAETGPPEAWRSRPAGTELAERYAAACDTQQAAAVAYDAAQAAVRQADRRCYAAREELAAAHDERERTEVALPTAQSEQNRLGAVERLHGARRALAAAEAEREAANSLLRAKAKAQIAARAALLALEDRLEHGDAIAAGVYQDETRVGVWLVVTEPASRLQPVVVTEVHRRTHQVVRQGTRAARTLRPAEGLDAAERARIMAAAHLPM